MKLQVQYFAILREQRGLVEETLATTAATPAALYEELRARHGFTLPGDRVRAAVMNSGCAWPQKRVTVGLSPAALPKHGAGLDLAIAVAVLAAAGGLPLQIDPATLWFGELALDGRVRAARGV